MQENILKHLEVVWLLLAILKAHQPTKDISSKHLTSDSNTRT